MALLSFVESAPRAYRLKVGNADLFRNSTEPGTSPRRASRRLGSFISAALLVLGLEFVSPDPMELHLWLHKSEYLVRVSAAQPKPDGGLSIVLYSHGTYLPSMPGGYLCSVEIVYENRNDLRLVSQSEDGRAGVRKVDGNFYFRYPPCG
jgi:hypothetical protein